MGSGSTSISARTSGWWRRTKKAGPRRPSPHTRRSYTLAKPKAQTRRKNPMSATENKKLIEDALGEWVRGDRAAFNNLLADDLRWTVIGNSPVSGRYNSKREFLEGAGARMRDKLATPIQTTPRHVIADV